MGLRAGLDWCGKPRPTGIRSPDCPARRQSLYRLRYPVHKLLCNYRRVGDPGIESRWGRGFPYRLDQPRSPTSLVYNGYRVLPGSKSAGT